MCCKYVGLNFSFDPVPIELTQVGIAAIGCKVKWASNVHEIGYTVGRKLHPNPAVLICTSSIISG